LARRPTTLLPLLYPGERGVSAQQIEQMEQLSRLSTTGLDTPNALAALRAAGVTHVYSGARGGPINDRELQRSSSYRLVYRGGATAIYELRNDATVAEDHEGS